MINRQSHIRNLLSASLGPTLAGELIPLIHKWEVSSGIEWTCSRIKAYYLMCKHRKAGNFEEVKLIASENGIALNRQYIPKGPFGSIIRRIVEAEKPNVLKRLMVSLRIYSVYSLSEVTKSQIDKHKHAISDPTTGIPNFRFDPKNLEHVWSYLRLPRLVRLRPPNMQRLKPFTSCYRVNMLAGFGPWRKTVSSMLSSVKIPNSLKSYNPNEVIRDALEKSGVESHYMGKITVLEEPGCKARVIAIPNFWNQWLFEPLHSKLNDIIKSLPQSAVHDQNIGASVMHRSIQSGKFLYCYDLSSATDRFPRSIQMQILELMGLDNYSKAIDEISIGPWDYLGEPISYEVGQPMGLYSSFPLFHLSHYVLLAYTCFQVGLRPDNQFYVLGDDVLIANERVASQYVKNMSDLGVTISPTKSVLSDRFGEFAGFLSIKTRKSAVTFRPYKFKADGFRSNAISLIDSLNSNSKYLGKYYRKLYSYYHRTKSMRNFDLTPLVPEARETDTRRNLDSYYLGSLTTEFSYQMDSYPEIDMNTWSKSYFSFLGNTEVASSGSYAMPLRVQTGVAFSKPEIIENNNDHKTHVSTDPLIKELRHKDSLEQSKDEGSSFSSLKF